ncbi:MULTISPECIES: hypothetical protein [unclassified Colwellia]|jgi:hypothetical protein|uniref:hypothetical protein n=1 Tax=unclassified Colwellia TaxID=196834 RepID=UPI0015F49CF3|nr:MULTISPECIES: hypothetical protein [unclassified Colwellia]MBA6251277.1 hypothetical protein [Colwellia sp. MB3u-55]MBA6254425.1 hypothetical protein [Colwellia sp. MB3u-28]MBA6258482.1 hypothetical protein [Colwellia sp. MB3u-41]MBA6302366.1 hypothetical protein [Colwellia sp. MB02u-14]
MKHFILFIALTLTGNSFATSIPCERTIQQETDIAQVVVVAEILSHKLNNEGVGDITFKVLRQWKGEQLKTIKVYANEGFPFSIAKSGFYLIYANRATHQEKPFWQIPWCKQITDVSYASEEMAILGKPKYVYE